MPPPDGLGRPRRDSRLESRDSRVATHNLTLESHSLVLLVAFTVERGQPQYRGPDSKSVQQPHQPRHGASCSVFSRMFMLRLFLGAMHYTTARQRVSRPPQSLCATARPETIVDTGPAYEFFFCLESPLPHKNRSSGRRVFRSVAHWSALSFRIARNHSASHGRDATRDGRAGRKGLFFDPDHRIRILKVAVGERSSRAPRRARCERVSKAAHRR